MPPDSLVHGPFLQHPSQQRIFQPVPSHASLSEQLGQATQEQGQEKALTQEAKIQAGRPAANTRLPHARPQTNRLRSGRQQEVTAPGGRRWGTSPGAPNIVQASSVRAKQAFIHVVCDASHNELVHAKTLVKGCVVLTDSARDPQR